MHVTTRIPGRRHDDLLRRNGGRGFPTLQFLDAEGAVLATLTERTVAHFEAALDALTRIDAVREAAAAGDPVAEADLLLMEHALGKVEVSMFRERAAMLAGPTPEQRERIDQVLVDLAIWEAVTLNDEENKGSRIERLWRAGKRPSDAPRYAVNFWSILGRRANAKGDAELLRGVVEGIRAQFPPDDPIRDYADSLEEAADRWEGRHAMARRLEAGEADLADDLLLLDAELGGVTVEEFRERMEAALAVADAEGKEAILQKEVDLEVHDLWIGVTTRRYTQEEAGRRLFALLFGDGRRPSEMAVRQGLIQAARWATARLDELPADRLRELSDTLERYLGENPYWKEVRAKVDARIAEIEREAEAEAPAGG